MKIYKKVNFSIIISTLSTLAIIINLSEKSLSSPTYLPPNDIPHPHYTAINCLCLRELPIEVDTRNLIKYRTINHFLKSDSQIRLYKHILLREMVTIPPRGYNKIMQHRETINVPPMGYR